MKLEQPKIIAGGNLQDRVTYLERYIFRLVTQLQMVLNQQGQSADKGGSNHYGVGK